MPIAGIDPGQSGGIAFLVEGTCPVAYKMPETETDIVEVLSFAKGKGYTFYIEKVHSMPEQGVSSSFKFGKNYGFLLGVLRAFELRTEHVSPQVWQRKLGCLSGGDKNVTKARAQELFPSIKVTHAIADSLLIAEYGRRHALGL